MAKKFKDYYDRDCALLLASKIAAVYPRFDQQKFVDFISQGITDKEFLARQDVFVAGFEKYLPLPYPQVIQIFTQVLGPELQTETGMFTHGWWLWPIGRYIEKHGTKDFKLSTDFIYQLTKRFTGEFAIRPLLESYPKQTMQLMLKWSKDQNVHVRRLASEGVRLNLPWAKKTLVALQEFEIYLQLLTNLCQDSSRFVQKSVGNNLNDLSKSHQQELETIINAWQQYSTNPATKWIIKHGQRSLRKSKVD